MGAVDPPFHLTAPAGGEDLWQLTVDLACGAGDFKVDLSAEEARIQLDESAGGRLLLCRLPEGTPPIDASAAVCRFSKRRGQLSVSWRGAPDPRAAPAPAAPTSLASSPAAASPGAPDAAQLEDRIEALRSECRSLGGKLSGGRPGGTEAEVRADRLAKGVADTITKMHTKAHSSATEGMAADQLAMVVDAALEMAGEGKDCLDRARLVMRIGQVLDVEQGELRVHCFDKASDVLECEAEEGRTQVPVALRAEALLLGAAAQHGLGEIEGAELRAEAALHVLGKANSEEALAVRARAQQLLGDILRETRPEEAQGRLQEAGELFRRVLDREATREAEEAQAFALPAGAERVPIWKYGYSDEEASIAIRVKLSEALFPGAEGAVTSQGSQLEAVVTQGPSKSADEPLCAELRIAAPRSAEDPELVCWVLRLAPLRYPVVPGAARVRLSRGTATMVLLKQDKLLWHDGPVRA